MSSYLWDIKEYNSSKSTLWKKIKRNLFMLTMGCSMQRIISNIFHYMKFTSHSTIILAWVFQRQIWLKNIAICWQFLFFVALPSLMFFVISEHHIFLHFPCNQILFLSPPAVPIYQTIVDLGYNNIIVPWGQIVISKFLFHKRSLFISPLRYCMCNWDWSGIYIYCICIYKTQFKTSFILFWSK